ncbi:hypothetical protein ACFQZ4_24260 [Catellatospora coxensis]|uniref:Uncharacterized protein n=1 Tax=Catellatospora coxensis TaxID=310354 RepID=A0A8J3L1R5_9ACTN|nr:hypothetical protein [Catellatospora coxensis]GIG10228.1 hypothetical protein Cco03nite_69280 [Catellatospora coxensis]
MSKTPDREQIATDLGRNHARAAATDPNGPAAKIAARLIERNERLAAAEKR